MTMDIDYELDKSGHFALSDHINLQINRARRSARRAWRFLAMRIKGREAYHLEGDNHGKKSKRKRVHGARVFRRQIHGDPQGEPNYMQPNKKHAAGTIRDPLGDALAGRFFERL